MVKSLFVELETDSMMIPWIYLCYNEGSLSINHADTPKKQPMSANSSKLIPGGTSTNINKSAAGA